VKKDFEAEEKIEKMGKKVNRTGKIILTVIIFISVVFAAPAQGDTAKKSPPGTEIQNQEKEKAKNGNLQNNQDEPGDIGQGNIQDNKKKQEDESKKVKEIKSTKPDMNKSKGARPPYISRPSGTIKPQGAGKPGGAIRPGRR
jgi:hypothetical protein